MSVPDKIGRKDQSTVSVSDVYSRFSSIKKHRPHLLQIDTGRLIASEGSLNSVIYELQVNAKCCRGRGGTEGDRGAALNNQFRMHDRLFGACENDGIGRWAV